MPYMAPLGRPNADHHRRGRPLQKEIIYGMGPFIHCRAARNGLGTAPQTLRGLFEAASNDWVLHKLGLEYVFIGSSA